jgi:phospholipase/carboxylesterase
MPAILPHLTFDSGAHPAHSIIWLHGLGADGEDFLPLASEIKLPVSVRYLFPHAPLQAVTLNGGAVMRSWYDISPSELDPALNHGRRTQTNQADLAHAQRGIEQLIAQEQARGIALSNIYLAGFSQGGALALHTGLRQTQALGGIIALSTYLPLVEENKALIQQSIFMAHGRQDSVVAYSLGMSAKNLLEKQGHQVVWHEYAMTHTVCAAEVRDIENWLTTRLGM